MVLRRGNSLLRSILVLTVAALLAPLVALGGPVGATSGYVTPLDIPLPVYRNVTDHAGLGAFLNGGYIGPGNLTGPRASFTEFTGPGACWLDHDGDGWLDLYLVSGIYQTYPEKNARDPHSRLYRNNGDGTFTDVTAATGARTSGPLQGCSAADYDSDGDTDLYVTGWNGSYLLDNAGGVFTDVADAAGVRDIDCGAFACWASSAAWFDADLDGCLDLFVSHFYEYDPANPPPYNGPSVGQRNRFFSSGCDGTFTDTTVVAGLHGVKSDTWSAVASDLNNDGWPDLYISNDGDENDVFLNDGDGTFTRKSFSAAHDPRAGMGTAIADFDHSGVLDIVTTNYISEHNGVYQAFGHDYLDIGGDAPFTDAWELSGWAVHWLDMDNDGHFDLMAANGATEDYGVTDPQHPLLAYRNVDGAGAFEAIKDNLGGDFRERFVGRGGAWADYDNDGDIDALITEAGEAPTHLLRADGVGNNFLNIDLRSDVAGVTRDAIGARATISAAGIPPQMQEKVAGSGFLGSNDPRLHYGLGDAGAASVTVRWPDGSVDTFGNVRANSYVRITQAVGLETVRTLPIVGLSGPTEVQQRLDPVAFVATATLPAGRSVSAVVWDFGDGTIETGGTTATHQFTDVGPFYVRATVIDDTGAAKAQWTRVYVNDTLSAAVQMTQDLYFPTDTPRGTVDVRFSDGAPVPFADVTVVVRRSTGDPGLDAVVAGLPFFTHQFAGFVPVTISGTTDGDGVFTFDVPDNLYRPSPLVRASATHIGTYHVEATGGARGSAFDVANVAYQVGVAAPV